ncbi:MAG TPA: methionyl-tRNA formyltransferase, partial [Dehalococcoidia bacterium]|nr:methionyl-tRNA formyltransferase [Dehalococcoidia bacterium]
MRIAVIGQAAFGKNVLEALVEKGEEIAAVLCPPDRKNRPFDPIKESAVEHDIRVCQYRRMRDEKA